MAVAAKGARKPKPGSGRLPGGSNGEPLHLLFDIVPRPKERARFSRGGFAYTPTATRTFETEVARQAAAIMAESGRVPFEVPVSVTATFYLLGDKHVWPTAQPDGDLDNHEKALLDALNKIAWRDDRLVVEKTSRKVCGTQPGIHVRIAPAGPAT